MKKLFSFCNVFKGRKNNHNVRMAAKKEQKIADVIHVYGQIKVAILHMLKPLKVGQTIHFKGHTSDFTQQVKSMQIEHEQVQKVKKGDDIGLKVEKDVRVGDEVFLAEE